jgi:pimeloyl-ACP methyl ester carboxylesterase
MARPRLLLVPEFTELAWAIKPELEDWAEVLSFDPPGVGTEPLPAGMADLGDLTGAIITTRGLEKLDQAGWERFFIVADGWGIANAVGIAVHRREGVVGMALGHAALSYARTGERAPINAAVYDAFTQLVKQDTPGFVRYGIAQVTQGGIDEERAQRIIERLPTDFMGAGWRALTADEPFGESLLQLGRPLLLAKHQGCLMNTDEGYEDAVAAMPRAETVVSEEPPSASPGFTDALQRFCERHWS